jgi:glycosyltransferase involved in cell wall biosynthesis
MASWHFLLASEDGSSHYRGVIPCHALSWEGHQTKWSSPQAPPDRRALKTDVVVASRLAHPIAMPMWQRLRDEQPRTRLVVDLDDDYFSIDSSNIHAKQFWEQGVEPNGNVVQQGGLLDNLRQAMKIADIVTVCSDVLAASIAMQGIEESKIRIVENGLHAGIKNNVRKKNPEMVTIGWAGSENTAAWLPMIKNVVNVAAVGGLGPIPFIQFVGIPAKKVADMGFRWRQDRGVVYEWIPAFDTGFPDYYHAFSQLDVVLAPYRSTPFTEAKFATKALEAGMSGVPILASPIGPYKKWIRHGWNGYLCHNENDWKRNLRLLLNSPERRWQMGLNADRRASRNTMQAVAKQWEDACLG